MEQPTIEVYNGIDYNIKYDFEHMTYIVSSEEDDSFLMTTTHYHKLIAWLLSYAKLTLNQIDDIGFLITRNFLKLVE